MLRKTVLPLVLVVGLIAVAGVAVAATGSARDSTVGSDAVVAMVTTTIADDGDAASPATAAAVGEAEGAGRSIAPAAPADRDDGYVGGDDDYDDGYVGGDDDYGDDDDYADDHEVGDDEYSDDDDDEYSDEDGDDYVDDDDDESSDDDDEYYDDGYEIADGVYPVDVSPYGTITVEVTDGMLYLVSIDVDPVWMLHKRDEKSDEVELGFYWDESELKIKVEIDDGQLKKMVEFDMDDDDDDEYSDDDSDDDGYSDDGYEIADGVYPVDVSPYGSITVEVTDGMLYLVSIDVDPVWMLHKRDEKSDEVELGFYWDESELKIKVEIDDGQLKKMVEFDMK